MATRAGLFTLLKDLIEIYGCDVNKITEDGQEMSPLHLAVTDFSDSTSHIINFLIESGAVVDALNVFGETPFYYAVIFDNTEAVRVLLERGADPHIWIRDPATPHQVRLIANMAVISGSLDIINALLDHNVDLTLTDTSMINALHMTVITRQTAIFNRLRPLCNMNSHCCTPCEAPKSVSRQIYQQTPMIIVSTADNNNGIVAKKYCNISTCDDTFGLSTLYD